MEFVNKITKLLEDKKAIDLTTLNIEQQSTLADYFILVSGTSNTHIKVFYNRLWSEIVR